MFYLELEITWQYIGWVTVFTSHITTGLKCTNLKGVDTCEISADFCFKCMGNKSLLFFTNSNQCVLMHGIEKSPIKESVSFLLQNIARNAVGFGFGAFL